MAVVPRPGGLGLGSLILSAKVAHAAEEEGKNVVVRKKRVKEVGKKERGKYIM